MDHATFAGTVSTVLFAAANLPMLIKAVRSRDLRSYSAGALVLGNLGNIVHTFYIVSLPFGPIWVLHGFYLTSMAIMLALYGVWASAIRRASADAPAAPFRNRARPTAVPFRHGGRHRRAGAGTGGLSVG